MSLAHSVAKGQLQRCSDDARLALEPIGKGFQLADATGSAGGDPRVERLCSSVAYHHPELADEHTCGIYLGQVAKPGSLLLGLLVKTVVKVKE
jgi:hypothetical protein